MCSLEVQKLSSEDEKRKKKLKYVLRAIIFCLYCFGF